MDLLNKKLEKIKKYNLEEAKLNIIKNWYYKFTTTRMTLEEHYEFEIECCRAEVDSDEIVHYLSVMCDILDCKYNPNNKIV